MERLWPDRDPYEPPSGCPSRLVAARKHRGVSQERMAGAVGLALATYRRLETGENTNPPLRYLVNCALVLRVELSSLIEDEWLEWAQLGNRGPVAPAEPSEFWLPSRNRPALPPAN